MIKSGLISVSSNTDLVPVESVESNNDDSKLAALKAELEKALKSTKHTKELIVKNQLIKKSCSTNTK